MKSLILPCFIWSHLRTELDATTDNSTYSEVTRGYVASWVCLTNMSSEGAAILGFGITRECVREVIVPRTIGTQTRIVLDGAEIQWSTYNGIASEDEDKASALCLPLFQRPTKRAPRNSGVIPFEISEFWFKNSLNSGTS